MRLEVGGPGFDFLGFHHRLVRSRGIRGPKGVTFLARWPSDKAMAHARDRLRECTARSRLLRPVEVVVGDMNMFLRGWSAYFRYGHSSDRFDTISAYATERLALFIGKRHTRGRRCGLSVLAYRVPDRCGLVRLVNGTRILTPWRQLKIDPLLVLWIFVESSGAAAGVLAGLVFVGAGASSSVGGLTAGG